MKTFRTSLYLFIFLFAACKKENKEMPSAGSINVINAVVDLANIKVNPTSKTISYKNTTDQVAYGAGKFYYAALGVASLRAVSALDTTMMLFNKTVDIKSSIYTMYISGKSPNIDTMFRKEGNYPFVRTDVYVGKLDSVVHVRFVNLSANSPALFIKVKGAVADEVSGLSYKGISNWKAYVAKPAASIAYIFEVRVDPLSVVPVVSYTFTANNANRYKNVALIVKGVYGTTTGVNAFGISAINYF